MSDHATSVKQYECGGCDHKAVVERDAEPQSSCPQCGSTEWKPVFYLLFGWPLTVDPSRENINVAV